MQDGLTGSAWGDWANYTASPLRAFENELGDWANYTAESLRPDVARGHSKPFLQKATVSSTEIAMTYLWIIVFALQFLRVCCVVQDVVSQHSLLLCLVSLLGLLSRFWCFLTRGFNIAWLFLRQLSRCPLSCFGCGCRARSRVRPCRFVGRRRFALRRRSRRCRASPFARLLSQFGSFFSVPVVVSIRCILHQLGLLGVRIGEASHPGPPGITSDPWATYLSSRAASKTASSTKLQAPTRAKWIDCIFDLSQLDVTSLDSPLAILSPDSFSENSSGLCMLTRALFAGVAKVRSLKPLLVVLPGGRNDDLLQLGFTTSAFSVHWMFIQEGPHGSWSRKLITLVQLGAKPILPISLADSPSWDITSSLEFVGLLSSRLFPNADSWASFLADSRSVVVSQIRDLHTDLSSVTTEFYGWAKIDAHTHRVIFRAPAAHKSLLLSASGILVSFIINLVCRDSDSRSQRDSESSVIWLGKLGYNESLVQVKRLSGHLGLALSRQSFGIRAPSAQLAAFRRAVHPDDSKFTDSNINVRGQSSYLITGLPLGCSRAEIIRRFAEWKVGDRTGWSVVPVKHWVSGGQSHWSVKADAPPLSYYYLCSNSRVLIQSEVRDSSAPKAKPARARSKSVPRSRPESAIRSSSDAAPSGPTVQRLATLEQRLDVLEARSSTLETQLQTGFAQILDRLDQRPAAARRTAEGPTGETPPPKAIKPAQSQSSVKPLALSG